MPKRILCYGDSNTWGAVPASPDRHPDEVRWTGVMARELGSGFTVIEEGYNGRTIAFDDPVEDRISGVSYLRACLDSQSPLDLVIFMLGTNDLKTRFNMGPVTIASQLDRLLDVLAIARMAGEKPQVLIASPPHMSPAYKDIPAFSDMMGPDAVERSRGFDAAYEQFARDRGLPYFRTSDYAAPAEKGGDGIHLGPDAHARLGRAMAAAVKKLV